MLFSLSLSLYEGRVSLARQWNNETYQIVSTFHIVVYTVDRIRGVPNRIQRSVPDLSWATFRRANLSFSFILRSYVCIYTHRFTISLIRSSWYERRYHGDKKKGIRNRSSHLSQTRPRHDTSRISWDNRFIYRRLEFLLETESRRHRGLEMSEKL